MSEAVLGRGAAAGCRRRGAQKFEIDVCRCSCATTVARNVVKLDLSFQMRIKSSPNSSGVPRFGLGTFQVDGCRMDPFFQDFETDVDWVVSLL